MTDYEALRAERDQLASRLEHAWAIEIAERDARIAHLERGMSDPLLETTMDYWLAAHPEDRERWVEVREGHPEPETDYDKRLKADALLRRSQQLIGKALELYIDTTDGPCTRKGTR